MDPIVSSKPSSFMIDEGSRSFFQLPILFFNFVTTSFYVCFVDGDKPWKQIKYKLNLTSIASYLQDHLKTVLIEKNEESDTKNAFLETSKILFEDINLPDTLPRTNYRLFIDTLRKALLLNSNNNPYQELLEKICIFRYTNFHFFSFCEILINDQMKNGILALNPPNKDTLLLKQLHEIPLKDQFCYLHAIPQEEKAPLLDLGIELIRGGCNFNSDAQRRGNIPYVLFDFTLKSIDIRVLRLSTPTRQRYNYETFTYEGKADIIPEFEGFIKGLKKENKSLVYCSLQDFVERSAGSEKARGDAFIHFANMYPGVFHLLILAHDSAFYHQTAPFDVINDASIFKKTFLDEMRKKESGFFFSTHLQDFEAFAQIFDEVHEDLFCKNTILSLNERLNFIKFYYIRIILFVLVKTKAPFLANVCKDSIDRAQIMNSILHYLLLILFQKQDSPEDLNAFYTYLHVAAFLVKKRAINSRKERLLSLLELLKSEDVKKRLLLRKASIGIEGNSLTILKQS